MNNSSSLLSLAQTAAARAYCPYSHFPVGAAVLSAAGNLYAGCNVENIAFPEGSCAETGAIAAMIAGGDRTIAEILIYAPAANLITPCGGCRQRIAEFSTPDTLIHLAGPNGIEQTLTLKQLLPGRFK